jgi:hypothetical protein
MPDTRLILHVKGTESETSELPKDAVRTAISQGKITHSQLIWSTADNAWKQVREWPDLMPPVEQLILHVKGTEAETRQLPKQEVRTGILHGQITHSQLIWSPPDNAWKQVRELPELLPSQKLAPAPTPSTVQPKAVEAAIPESPSVPVARAAVAADAKPQVRMPVALTGSPKPKVAVAAVPKVAAVQTPQARVPSIAGSAPQVKVAVAAPGAQKPRVAAVAATAAAREAAVAPGRYSGALEVDHEDHFHPFKWICIGLGVLIVLVLGANFLLVDQPLVSKFGKTSYSDVTVFAHFGAFMQPNVMVIHIPASSKITADNLPDILIALARSSPGNPITGTMFTRVAITSGWTAQYSFSGDSWVALAEQDQEGEAQRKEFLMGQMDDAGGQSVLPASTLNEDAQKVKRDQVWNEFVAHFTK